MLLLRGVIEEKVNKIDQLRLCAAVMVLKNAFLRVLNVYL